MIIFHTYTRVYKHSWVWMFLVKHQNLGFKTAGLSGERVLEIQFLFGQIIWTVQIIHPCKVCKKQCLCFWKCNFWRSCLHGEWDDSVSFDCSHFCTYFPWTGTYYTDFARIIERKTNIWSKKCVYIFQQFVVIVK